MMSKIWTEGDTIIIKRSGYTVLPVSPVRKYYQEYAWNLDGLRPEIVKKSDFPAIARRTWNSEKNRLGKSEYPP